MTLTFELSIMLIFYDKITNKIMKVQFLGVILQITCSHNKFSKYSYKKRSNARAMAWRMHISNLLHVLT